MTNTSRLWKVLAALMVVSFGILLYFGREIYVAAPPIPTAVKTTTGETLYTREQYDVGRQVWQRVGGHQMGSIWGHGSYVAPDWSADWLHREATALLELWAQRDTGKAYADLDAVQQAGLQARLQQTMRENTYDPATGVITVDADRAQAIRQVNDHYMRLFGPDVELNTLRAQYAIQQNPIPDVEQRQAMMAFFFWTSWSASTNRPDNAITYTSNWPSESLGGNTPTGSTVVWSVLSFVAILAGVGALVWHYGARRRADR